MQIYYIAADKLVADCETATCATRITVHQASKRSAAHCPKCGQRYAVRHSEAELRVIGIFDALETPVLITNYYLARS